MDKMLQIQTKDAKNFVFQGAVWLLFLLDHFQVY